MTHPGEIIASLLDVLATERTAIRRLDGAAVERAAVAKEEAASILRELPPEALREHSHALACLRSELRRNGMLLSHARACLREASGLVTSGADARSVLVGRRV